MSEDDPPGEDLSLSREATDKLAPLPKFKKRPVLTFFSAPGALTVGDSEPKTPTRPTAKSSDLPTPLMKAKVEYSIRLSDNLITDAALKTFLTDVFTTQIHRNYPVVEFVKKVFKFSPSDLPRRKQISLPVEACRAYAVFDGERNCYGPLKRIFDSLHRQVCRTDATRPLNAHFVSMYDRQPDSSTGAKLKPDFYFSTQPNRQTQHWVSCLGYGEVKRRSKKVVFRGKGIIDTSLFGLEPTRYSLLFQGAKGGRHKQWSTRSRKRKEVPSGPGTLERASKRRRSSTTIPEEMNEEVLFNGPSDTARALTENELQSAKYINEMMSHGVRNYATGWLLQDTTMTLWYADRMGLVQSAPFDIFEESHLLLLFVAALARADHRKLGFCPLLTFPSRAKEDKQFKNYDGATLDLPMALDCDAKTLPKLKFSVVPEYAIHTDLGTIGRGTTVIPVKARGTAARQFGKERLIAKIAWPVMTRHREDTFIRKIRLKLKDQRPEFLKHVVNLKCSFSRTMEELDLPRAFMDDLPVLENFEKRVLLCLVMEEYSPLESVNNIGEFKAVFIDVIKAHHWVYETSKILHRDISVSNIMYHREKGAAGTVRGVLCDWDLAYDPESPYPFEQRTLQVNPNAKINKDDIVIEKHDKDHVGPCYRTGTGPFMALDLLEAGRVPFHLYRHDLESFFFVLVWFCAVFDPETHTFGHIKNWENSDLASVGINKRYFLQNRNAQKTIFANTSPEYRSLMSTWIRRLLRMFESVNVIEHAKLEQIAKEEEWSEDEEWAMDNSNSDDNTRRLTEIEQIQRSRNEAVTYDKFMKHLDIDVGKDQAS